MIDINFKKFPITRYQGSKRKIVYWINDVLNEIDCEYESVLDGFGGTGSVSYLFKKLGKNVTYNDNLRFNYLIGKALIENQQYKLDNNNEIEKILNFSSANNVVERNFNDVYFLPDENKWIDNTIAGIESVFDDESYLDSFKSSIAYYALFQSCLIKRPFNLFHRKNLTIRTNDVKRNFGNKTSWEKPFEDLFKKFINEANTLVFDNNNACQSLNRSIFDVNELGYDLVYLDPPYFLNSNSHETSNYFRCYHFLEGLANYSDWEHLIDNNSLNKRLKSNSEEIPLNKYNISEKLEELIYKFKNSIIVFSYKDGGVPSVDFLVKIMEKLNKKVYLKSTHYKYALNRQNGDALKNREVLIVGI